MFKYRCKWLRLMLERCRQIQLSLNIRKCIFVTPIGILLGQIVCKEGIKFEFANIKIILDLKPPINPKQVRVLLGHTGYYRKFIRYYSDMTYPLEEIVGVFTLTVPNFGNSVVFFQVVSGVMTQNSLRGVGVELRFSFCNKPVVCPGFSV